MKRDQVDEELSQHIVMVTALIQKRRSYVITIFETPPIKVVKQAVLSPITPIKRNDDNEVQWSKLGFGDNYCKNVVNTVTTVNSVVISNSPKRWQHSCVCPRRSLCKRNGVPVVSNQWKDQFTHLVSNDSNLVVTVYIKFN